MSYISAASLVYNIGQGIFTGMKRRRTERQAEREMSQWQVSPGVKDYYNKALARYSPNLYQSAFYNTQMNNVNRNLTTGIGAAQTRRAGVGAIGSLVAQANRAAGQTAAQSEQMQGQDLARYGQAAGQLAQQENAIRSAKMNLLLQKAAGEAGTENAFYAGANESVGALSQIASANIKAGKKWYGA